MTKRSIRRLTANGLIEDAYHTLVAMKVAQRYSLASENAIMRKAFFNLPGAQEEAAEYNAYVEQCKRDAKTELGMV